MRNFKFLTVVLASLFFSILIVFALYISLLKLTNRNHAWQLDRIKQSIDYLNLNAQSFSNLIPIIGSSDIEAGLNPTAIKQAQSDLNNYEILNLGHRDLSARQLYMYTSKIKEISLKSKVKFKLSVLNFSPNMMTQKTKSNSRYKIEDDLALSYLSSADIVQLQSLDLLDRQTLLFKKYFFFNRDITLSGLLFKLFIEELFMKEDNPIIRHWYSAEIHTQPAWNASQLGYFNHLSDNTALNKMIQDFFQSAKGQYYLQKALDQTSDITGLNFEENSLYLFSKSVENLKLSSEKVVITLLPYKPGHRPNPVKINEILQFLGSIDKEVQFYNLDDFKTMSSKDYKDIVHFNSDGFMKVHDFFSEIISQNIK